MKHLLATAALSLLLTNCTDMPVGSNYDWCRPQETQGHSVITRGTRP